MYNPLEKTREEKTPNTTKWPFCVATHPSIPVKRKRGRPKGSKSKAYYLNTAFPKNISHNSSILCKSMPIEGPKLSSIKVPNTSRLGKYIFRNTTPLRYHHYKNGYKIKPEKHKHKQQSKRFLWAENPHFYQPNNSTFTYKFGNEIDFHSSIPSKWVQNQTPGSSNSLIYDKNLHFTTCNRSKEISLYEPEIEYLNLYTNNHSFIHNFTDLTFNKKKISTSISWFKGKRCHSESSFYTHICTSTYKKLNQLFTSLHDVKYIFGNNSLPCLPPQLYIQNLIENREQYLFPNNKTTKPVLEEFLQHTQHLLHIPPHPSTHSYIKNYNKKYTQLPLFMLQDLAKKEDLIEEICKSIRLITNISYIKVEDYLGIFTQGFFTDLFRYTNKIINGAQESHLKQLKKLDDYYSSTQKFPKLNPANCQEITLSCSNSCTNETSCAYNSTSVSIKSQLSNPATATNHPKCLASNLYESIGKSTFACSHYKNLDKFSPSSALKSNENICSIKKDIQTKPKQNIVNRNSVERISNDSKYLQSQSTFLSEELFLHSKDEEIEIENLLMNKNLNFENLWKKKLPFKNFSETLPPNVFALENKDSENKFEKLSEKSILSVWKKDNLENVSMNIPFPSNISATAFTNSSAHISAFSKMAMDVSAVNAHKMEKFQNGSKITGHFSTTPSSDSSCMKNQGETFGTQMDRTFKLHTQKNNLLPENNENFLKSDLSSTTDECISRSSLTLVEKNQETIFSSQNICTKSSEAQINCMYDKIEALTSQCYPVEQFKTSSQELNNRKGYNCFLKKRSKRCFVESNDLERTVPLKKKYMCFEGGKDKLNTIEKSENVLDKLSSSLKTEKMINSSNSNLFAPLSTKYTMSQILDSMIEASDKAIEAYDLLYYCLEFSSYSLSSQLDAPNLSEFILNIMDVYQKHNSYTHETKNVTNVPFLEKDTHLDTSDNQAQKTSFQFINQNTCHTRLEDTEHISNQHSKKFCSKDRQEKFPYNTRNVHNKIINNEYFQHQLNLKNQLLKLPLYKQCVEEASGNTQTTHEEQQLFDKNTHKNDSKLFDNTKCRSQNFPHKTAIPLNTYPDTQFLSGYIPLIPRISITRNISNTSRILKTSSKDQNMNKNSIQDNLGTTHTVNTINLNMIAGNVPKPSYVRPLSYFISSYFGKPKGVSNNILEDKNKSKSLQNTNFKTFNKNYKKAFTDEVQNMREQIKPPLKIYNEIGEKEKRNVEIEENFIGSNQFETHKTSENIHINNKQNSYAYLNLLPGNILENNKVDTMSKKLFINNSSERNDFNLHAQLKFDNSHFNSKNLINIAHIESSYPGDYTRHFSEPQNNLPHEKNMASEEAPLKQKSNEFHKQNYMQGSFFPSTLDAKQKKVKTLNYQSNQTDNTYRSTLDSDSCSPTTLSQRQLVLISNMEKNKPTNWHYESHNKNKKEYESTYVNNKDSETEKNLMLTNRNISTSPSDDNDLKRYIRKHTLNHSYNSYNNNENNTTCINSHCYSVNPTAKTRNNKPTDGTFKKSAFRIENHTQQQIHNINQPNNKSLSHFYTSKPSTQIQQHHKAYNPHSEVWQPRNNEQSTAFASHGSVHDSFGTHTQVNSQMEKCQLLKTKVTNSYVPYKNSFTNDSSEKIYDNENNNYKSIVEKMYKNTSSINVLNNKEKQYNNCTIIPDICDNQNSSFNYAQFLPKNSHEYDKDVTIWPKNIYRNSSPKLSFSSFDNSINTYPRHSLNIKKATNAWNNPFNIPQNAPQTQNTYNTSNYNYTGENTNTLQSVQSSRSIFDGYYNHRRQPRQRTHNPNYTSEAGKPPIKNNSNHIDNTNETPLSNLHKQTLLKRIMDAAALTTALY